jgi:hypothetical protein
VEVRVKHALQNLLGNLMHRNRHIIPCICHKFDGINNDDLGNKSGRFVEDQVEMVLAQKRVGGIRSVRVIEYFILVMIVNNFA